MQSALIIFMIQAGWRLGYPLAVVIEETNEQGIFLVNAWVGYIVGADHAQLVFKDKLQDVFQKVQLPTSKHLHIHSRKEWEIPLGEQQTMFIGQSIPFIRRAGFWAADLHAHQELAVRQAGGTA